MQEFFFVNSAYIDLIFLLVFLNKLPIELGKLCFFFIDILDVLFYNFQSVMV